MRVLNLGRRGRHSATTSEQPAYRPGKFDRYHPYEVEPGNIQHFISLDKEDGRPVGHSKECSEHSWEPWPCGCHMIKRSGGTSPRCDEYRRLEDEYDRLCHMDHGIHPEDFDLLEAHYAAIKAAQRAMYKHYCICLAFDRPERRPANVYPNGLQMDVPLAVLRSHPKFPGLLPDKWEGRWVSLNPAWPEMSIDYLVAQLRAKCVWSREESSLDLVEHRDGLEGVIAYIKPVDELPWLTRQFTLGLLKEIDLVDLFWASLKNRLHKEIQVHRIRFNLKSQQLATEVKVKSHALVKRLK